MIKELDFDKIRTKLGAPKDHIMNGKKVAKLVRKQVKANIDELKSLGAKPTLAVVRVGDDPASKTYVKWKIKACDEVGIHSEKIFLPESTTQHELNDTLDALNKDDKIDAILLQLPLPKHLRSIEAIDLISPEKDADGFHPLNLGFLLARSTHLEACTPRGVMILLAAYGIDLEGADVCVIGRSVMVGRPMAQMLIRANATVTVCHRYTKNLSEYVKRADVVVVATGVAHLVKGEWIKEGAVVIDIGQSCKDGKILGDVDYDEAVKRARLITPVPGGVGPMTVAALMANTALAAWYRLQKRESQDADLGRGLR